VHCLPRFSQRAHGSPRLHRVLSSEHASQDWEGFDFGEELPLAVEVVGEEVLRGRSVSWSCRERSGSWFSSLVDIVNLQR